MITVSNVQKMAVFVLLSYLIVGTAYADDLSLEPNANKMFSMLLWSFVVLGSIAGFVYRQYLHRRLKSHENIKGGIVAVLVALTLAYIPYLVGGYGQFSKSCLTNLTDGTGVVRQEVVLAEECVIAREEISALGIKPVISTYKSSFGYVQGDRYLSTSGVVFFYGIMLALWTMAVYSLGILLNKVIR